MPGAQHGRRVKAPAELPFVKTREFVERGSEVARRKARVAGGRGAPIPRAHVLANVTAKNMRTQVGLEMRVDRPTQFDGQVGDAAARIQHSGPDESARGTGIQAARATAAAVRRRGAGFDGERNQEFAQKEPRAPGLVNQTGVLADPPEPRARGQRPFEHGSRVHADLIVEGRACGYAQLFGKLRQSAAHELVIILAPGVPGDPAEAGRARVRRERSRGVVKFADHDDRARRRQQKTRIRAQAGAMVREVAHLPGHAGVHPLRVTRVVVNGPGRSHAG